MSASSVDTNKDFYTIVDPNEAARDRRSRAGDKNREQGPDATDATALETRFSQLLRGRLTSNIVFSRLDQTLNLPQKVVSDRQQAPIVDRRDDIPKDDNTDDFDANGHVDQPARNDSASAADTGGDYSRNAPDVSDTRDAHDDGSQNPDAAAAAGQQNGPANGQDKANAAQANAANANKSAAANAAQRTVSADAMPEQQVTPEMMELAKQAAKKGGAKLTATVTTENPQLSSQPQTVLSAKAAVDAAAQGKKGEAAQAQLSANAEGDAAAEAEDGANNIFNRLKSEAAAGKAGNAARAATGSEGTDAAKAAATNAQAAAAPTPQMAPGLQRAMAAGGQVSSLTGTSQSGVTTDASTGGTATLGQNNSVQQRSAPAPTAHASRPPPVPAHVVADQVAVNIQRGLAQGQDRITVQLRPQELGRVEIKMEMNHDGKMTAVVTAERPETLDMLRQDSRSLLQALGEAGLDADESSLSFELQGGETGDDGGSESASGRGSGSGSADVDDLIETGFMFEETGGFTGDGRLDVKI